ncbi:SRPBCC family protein [Winogradskya humida]|uniref:Polyketide cyclase n=1 Tax=Winogradskya humida TaxID=113566 RepID=A0ABQ4A7B2_9ACTN|nr:SRPBCC family protein [Actinoplanes humidus]GIE26746.1 polyketide cyclase [Actinoplanes humidus]
MATETRHLAVAIDKPAADVYAYASDPTNIPQWAPGLGTSVEQVDGVWYVDTPGGRLKLDYAPQNEYLVLDHTVTLPTGDSIYNPFRVLRDGDDSEVVFTLRRRPGMTDEEWAADADAVLADLTSLKRIVEGAG